MVRRKKMFGAVSAPETEKIDAPAQEIEVQSDDMSTAISVVAEPAIAENSHVQSEVLVVAENTETATADPPVKIHHLREASSEPKNNRFDLFCIKIWAAIVSFVSHCANGINAVVYAISKKRLPLRYVKAFVAGVLIVLSVVVVSLPFGVRVEKDAPVDVYGDGLIPVKYSVGVDENGHSIDRWGYSDKKGNLVLPKNGQSGGYTEALPFRHGVAWVRITVKEELNGNTIINDYWQLIGKTGKQKGKNQFYYTSNNIRPVNEFPKDCKLALVCEAGLYGFVNTSGNKKIPTRYKYAESFCEGLARVRLGINNEQFIDVNGKQVGANYQEVRSFSEGLGAVNHNGVWGFINKKGKVVIAPEFDAVTSFFGGYAAVRRGITYGIVDNRGNFIVELGEYKDLCVLSDVFRVMIDQIQLI